MYLFCFGQNQLNFILFKRITAWRQPDTQQVRHPQPNIPLAFSSKRRNFTHLQSLFSLPSLPMPCLHESYSTNLFSFYFNNSHATSSGPLIPSPKLPFYKNTTAQEEERQRQSKQFLRLCSSLLKSFKFTWVGKKFNQRASTARGEKSKTTCVLSWVRREIRKNGEGERGRNK